MSTAISPPCVPWPDAVDEVLGGDQCIALATVTPARGVVLLPVTNFGVRDRRAGTIEAVNSSVGVSKKLERIRRNPSVALVYHSRVHGWTTRPEYVLVQGRASLGEPNAHYIDTIREAFEKYAGGHPKPGIFSRRWLRAWYIRVGITVAVERIVVWPNLSCRGQAALFGTPLPSEPPASQAPPKNGTHPRLDHKKAAQRAAQKAHSLLGWVDSDGYPFVIPVGVAGADERGILLIPPPALVPPGQRRAGFTAHRFGNYNVGQHQLIHTGWMVCEDDRISYAPHTKTGYRMPRSKVAYKLMAGAATTWGLRTARQRGFMPNEGRRQGSAA